MCPSLRHVLSTLLLALTACGVDRSTAPAAPTGSGPPEGAAVLSNLALVVDAQGNVSATTGFIAARGCPVIPGDATATLNGRPLALLRRGHGEWVTGRTCSSTALFPSFCVGETRATLSCQAPRLEGAVGAAAALAAPLVLELTSGERSDALTFPVTLASLRWKAEPQRDGSLRLTWQGALEPDLTRAELVRVEAPSGTWPGVVKQRSRTELVLPDAARWAPGAIELTTSTSMQRGIFLQVEVRQVVTL
jgi:hypothetical protein